MPLFEHLSIPLRLEYSSLHTAERQQRFDTLSCGDIPQFYRTIEAPTQYNLTIGAEDN
jgi:hypothetical protein